MFDDKKQFSDWFDTMLGDDNSGTVEEQLLATEKKLVVVHRLHQILVPFMLRRQASVNGCGAVWNVWKGSLSSYWQCTGCIRSWCSPCSRGSRV